MYINYEKTKVFYDIKNKEKQNTILFLHGWGAGSEVLIPIVKNFYDYKCVLIDFPPFINSEEPKKVWSLIDYAKLTIKVLKKENIDDRIQIFCHSFGARVAILLTQMYNGIESLVMVGSAGLKPRKNLLTQFKIIRYKVCKFLKIKQNNCGSNDYQKLSPIMQQTFINIVNTDLKNVCKKIVLPTLLIFGENDKETPLYMAKRFKKLIKNSTLIVVKNAGHYVWLDDYNLVINKTKNFFDYHKKGV